MVGMAVRVGMAVSVGMGVFGAAAAGSVAKISATAVVGATEGAALGTLSKGPQATKKRLIKKRFRKARKGRN